jgi:hypothetical protein
VKRPACNLKLLKVNLPEAYDMALAGEIDALPAVERQAKEKKHFLLSEPYYYFKRVIVTCEYRY